MAKFAELDANNIVMRVLCVDNSMIVDSNGIEQEDIGVEFLKSLLGSDTIWKQTSFTGAFRKHFAGIGYIYDQEKDAFIPPKPNVAPEIEKYVYFDEDKLTWIVDTPTIGVTRI